MRTLKYLSLLLFGLLIASMLGGCNKRGGLQIGDPIPDITLTDFQGKSVTLPRDIKGKVALIRFWSLDCGFCDKEILLAFESFYHKYKDKSFIPVAIN